MHSFYFMSVLPVCVIWMSACMNVCMCTWRSDEGIRSPRIRIRDGCEQCTSRQQSLQRHLKKIMSNVMADNGDKE